MPSPEEYASLWEEVNRSVQSAVRAVPQTHLASEKAKADHEKRPGSKNSFLKPANN